MSILEIILAIFLPPVVVFMKKGAGLDLVINLVLWIFLFGIGGIIHAFWILSKK
ncbi:MAG: YqaE/Pmp3 family membrane protein [Verrucomicrobiota bacterium]